MNITQQIIIDFITADNNTSFGDHYKTKDKGIRIKILHNTDGLDLDSHTLTTRELIYNCTKREVDEHFLFETNTK